MKRLCWSGCCRCFPKHSPVFGSRWSRWIPGVSRPPHRGYVSHDSPTGVCRGPYCTEAALAAVPVVWDDKASGRHGGTTSGVQAPVWQPHCGTCINTSLTCHVMSFHLDLGQLWRCLIPWWSVWKGITQDCVDHLRLRHHAGSSVEAITLGKFFLPWTVTRSAWGAALRARESGIATDMMLFSQHGARLVHRYHMFADSVPHQSLHGSFMTKHSGFTHQASAEAHSAAKRGRDSSAESTPSPL